MDRFELTVKAKTLDGEWVEGYYVRAYGFQYFSTKEYVHLICGESINDTLIDPSTICMCTGLTDKNGKLIYEGDIVMACAGAEYQGIYEFMSECIVKWQSTGFDLTINDVGQGWGFCLDVEDIIVIGSIHDRR